MIYGLFYRRPGVTLQMIYLFLFRTLLLLNIIHICPPTVLLTRISGQNERKNCPRFEIVLKLLFLPLLTERNGTVLQGKCRPPSNSGHGNPLLQQQRRCTRITSSRSQIYKPQFIHLIVALLLLLPRCTADATREPGFAPQTTTAHDRHSSHSLALALCTKAPVEWHSGNFYKGTKLDSRFLLMMIVEILQSFLRGSLGQRRIKDVYFWVK